MSNWLVLITTSIVETCTGPIGGDIFHWKGKIWGPPNTPYSGAIFPLTINFPEDYPILPPEVLIYISYHIYK